MSPYSSSLAPYLSPGMAEAAALAFAKNAALFMGKTAAGAAISYLVNKALGRLGAEDEDLRRSLTAKLPIIEAVFSASDQRHVGENKALGVWLWLFRDAIQEAEDALEVLEFLDLEKKVKDQRSQEAKDWRAKLYYRFRSIGRAGEFRQSLSANSTGGTTKSLRDALKTLDSVLDNAEIFLNVIRHRLHCSSAGNREPEDLANKHETTRELTTTVFGRQKDKDAIVKWLGIETPDTLDHGLSVCAIVGGGGMGKTTLAQFICQDKMVQDHFGNMIIWVHVSKSFDPKVLVRRILESIKWDKSSAEALDSLQSDLTKQLATSRFLLVLDDAWEDTENQRWEQFLGPLRNNALMGGKILLTTRMRSVADAVKLQMPSGYKLWVLEGLDQEDTVKLFNHHVFGESIPNYCRELQLIGEQIAKKLKGCPFVAKVIGQQLRDSTDISRWNTILNQDIHQIDEIVPTIMETLKLSYQNLTSEVQLCFRFCSIFPPHYKFKMDEVIEMWVSSGLILQRENSIKNQEDIAREHFNVLSRKSFFSMVPRELNADPSEDYYVLHDLMYELACFISSDECSRFKDGDHESDISPRVRHLYIQRVNSGTVKIISQSKYLRTLVIANEGNSIQQELVDDLKKAIKGRTSLRFLKLCGHGWFGMNDAVAELKHLRYIYMSATDEPTLCKLFKLCHLKVLQIIKIEKEEKVSPIEIGNLPCLEKLYLPKDILSRIPHIGRLCTLREVNGFSVRKKDGHRITELQDLRNLQKIIVLDVQNISNCNEADAAKLDDKSNLKALSLGWSDDQSDAQILDKLVPHRNLKNLIISGYNGIQPPIWMKHQYLSNLVHLKLDGCVEWSELPPLDSLKALKHVLLAHLPKLKYITSSSHGYDAYGYRENSTKGTCPGRLPPHLFTFVVKDCPQLSKLPVLPFSLQFLGVDAVGMLRLPTMSDEKTMRDAPILEPKLSVLYIESCKFLVSLNGSFIQEEHYKALTVLKLFRCHALRSLPDAAHFQRISEMESVEIVECNSLSSLGGLGGLSCLKVLKIERCGNLLLHTPEESLSLELEKLSIDDHQLLALSQLKNLCRTRRLIISGISEVSPINISDRSEMDLLPDQLLLPEKWLLQNSWHLEHIEINNAGNLQSLPSMMHDLYKLRTLILHNTSLLQSLPLMPPHLWVLIINGCCTELKKQCQIGGSEWLKIHQIPHCHIYPKRDDRYQINYDFEGSFS